MGLPGFLETRMSDPEDDPGYIGIPNVPAIVWQAEMERARARLDQGLCPNCGEEMIDDECPCCHSDDD